LQNPIRIDKQLFTYGVFLVEREEEMEKEINEEKVVNKEIKLQKTTLTKSKTVDVETKKGGKYSYRYTELADINDYIDSINERYYQIIQKIDGDDYIFTKRIGENAPQELLQGCKVLTAPVTSEYSNPAQEQGSALTYARRYSLLMAYGLATEDDDASSLNRDKKEIETIEEAREYKLNFGKNKGKTLGEISETDGSYLDWLYNGEKTDEVLKKCITLIYENPNKTNVMSEMPVGDGQIEIIKDMYKDKVEDLKLLLKKLNKTKLNQLTYEEAEKIKNIINEESKDVF
jgi:hypothetical protein